MFEGDAEALRHFALFLLVYYLQFMNAKEKSELIEKLVKSNDEDLLSQIKAILDGSQHQLWDEMNPILKASIQRGVDQSNQRIGMVHEEIMKEYRANF
mgnify:CR=1 FL=1